MVDTARSEEGLSIGALSRATGISIHSLRMWERRYGAPLSFRRPSGHRRYPYDEVQRVRAVARALGAGFRAGEVAGASLDEIEKLLTTMKGDGASPSANGNGSIHLKPASEVIEDWIHAVRDFDETLLAREFRDAWAKMGPLRFLTERATPFIKAIGDGWQCGELCVSEEHFACEQLNDFLSQMWRRHNESCAGVPYIVMTLPRDSHRVGLNMVAVVVAYTEHRVIFLGAQTPPEEIPKAVEKTGAGAVCVSVSSSQQTRVVLKQMETLRSQLPANVHLICGGGGAPQGIEGVLHFEDLIEFYEHVRTLDDAVEETPLPVHANGASKADGNSNGRKAHAAI